MDFSTIITTADQHIGGALIVMVVVLCCIGPIMGFFTKVAAMLTDNYNSAPECPECDCADEAKTDDALLIVHDRRTQEAPYNIRVDGVYGNADEIRAKIESYLGPNFPKETAFSARYKPGVDPAIEFRAARDRWASAYCDLVLGGESYKAIHIATFGPPVVMTLKEFFEWREN